MNENIPPQLMHVALGPWDRARLFGAGVLAFRPGAVPVKYDETPKPAYQRKPGADQYGRLRDFARRYVAGEFPGMSYYDVAAANKLPPESFKNSVWKERNAAGTPVRRKSGRAAA